MALKKNIRVRKKTSTQDGSCAKLFDDAKAMRAEADEISRKLLALSQQALLLAERVKELKTL